MLGVQVGRVRRGPGRNRFFHMFDIFLAGLKNVGPSKWELLGGVWEGLCFFLTLFVAYFLHVVLKSLLGIMPPCKSWRRKTSWIAYLPCMTKPLTLSKECAYSFMQIECHLYEVETNLLGLQRLAFCRSLQAWGEGFAPSILKHEVSEPEGMTTRHDSRAGVINSK